MSALTNYLENKLLDHITGVAAYTMPSGLYVKLHLGDPGEDATANPATETTRAAAAFVTNAASGTISNTTAITWTGVSTTETVTHVSIWDASTAGNPLMKGALSASKALTAGDNLTIAIGDLDLSFD